MRISDWSSDVCSSDLNWQLTARWRQRFSHCLLFNPTDPRSARYNPLLEVRKGPYEVRDVQNIGDILVDPEGALERRNHWEKTSHSLLRSEEHTSELQSLMRISYAVFCLKKNRDN